MRRQFKADGIGFRGTPVQFHMVIFIWENFSINPGCGGLFLEDRITHDGSVYVRRTGISSNVTADNGDFEREKCLVGP